MQQLLGLPDWLEVVLFAAAGIPVYVCASGATPLAAAFVWAGVSPGAALAFLMAGPATNVTTFATLTQLHGRRIAVAFAMSVLAMSVASGWMLNVWDIKVLSSASGSVEGHAWWSWMAFALVALMFLDSLFRKGPGQWVSSVLNFGHDDHDHNHGPAQTSHPLIMKPSAAPRLKGTGFKVVIPKATTGCADCDCDH
ncbi:MAG: permease [bacterium]